jgi:hypothetical protein
MPPPTVSLPHSSRRPGLPPRRLLVLWKDLPPDAQAQVARLLAGLVRRIRAVPTTEGQRDDRP